MRPQILIGSKFVDGVIPLIAGAQHSIDIIIYDLRLYPQNKNHPVTRLITALYIALKRGVRVRILGSNAHVRAMLGREGFSTRELYTDKMVHAKMMLIDSCIVVIGSHNYTQSAFTQNLEISIALDLGCNEEHLQKYFNTLWGI